MNRASGIVVCFFFLISHIGIALHMHYSGGRLYSIAVFTEAEGCCNENRVCSSSRNDSFAVDRVKDNSCCSCEDRFEYVKVSHLFVLAENIPATEIFCVVHSSNNDYRVDSYPVVFNYRLVLLFPITPGKRIDFQAQLGVFLC